MVGWWRAGDLTNKAANVVAVHSRIWSVRWGSNTSEVAKVVSMDVSASSVWWMNGGQRWISEMVVVRFVLSTRCATVELGMTTTLFLTESLTLTRSKET